MFHVEQMKNIRITKDFTFEMAHALACYDGLCRNIHGHSYKLEVTVIGKPLEDDNHPKNGMVIDFSVIKKIVKDEIVDKLDHALMLRENDELAEYFVKINETGIKSKLVWTKYQPTCENMLIDFAHTLKKAFDGIVKLHSLKLHETATSYAEWYASDNE